MVTSDGPGKTHAYQTPRSRSTHTLIEQSMEIVILIERSGIGVVLIQWNKSIYTIDATYVTLGYHLHKYMENA